MTILLLGGTGEARALAQSLHEEGIEFRSSLAGRVARPRMPAGETRVGGFGGVEGLADYLLSHRVSGVVDATHPFAAGISANAAEACRHTGVPLLRLVRPGWGEHSAGRGWHWVAGHGQAAEAAARLGRRVLLTTGRQNLHRFTEPLSDHRVVARVVDPVEIELPAGWSVLLDRGPYTVEGERALLLRHGIDVLVTKDSGGDYTRAKLDAADELGAAVVVVRRPPLDDQVASVTDVGAALRWLRSMPG